MKTEEMVFCLRRIDIEPLFGGLLPQGYFAGKEMGDIFSLPHHFIPRAEAEIDPAYKQLIPYQLFRRNNRFFVYQRGGYVGEGRLAGRLSVGIGGHINTEDADRHTLTPEAYRSALLRERQEELECPADLGIDFAGWINDDSDPVGRVHLGAVHLCHIEDFQTVLIRKNGEDIHQVGWWSLEEIKAKGEEFEKWSLLAVGLVASLYS
jgi:predicted NUDIX family phosphoesterase